MANEYNTPADYDVSKLNEGKRDAFKTGVQAAKADAKCEELDLGDEVLYDYRLKDNGVVYGD
jgi:hypothetical protein